jgi:hypothetical protein
MTRPRPWIVLASVLGLLAPTALPAAAANPADYLTGMPAVAAVEAAFTGTDPLDTYALRLDAFLRLENVTKDLIGARGAAGQATRAEADLVAAYDDAQNRAIAAAKATMPADQQGFYVGTQFTLWAQVADRYQADPSFNTRFRKLFPAKFVSTHAALFTKEEKADAVPLAPPTATGPAPASGNRAPFAPNPDPPDPGQYLPIAAWLGAYFALFVVLGVLRPNNSAKKAKAS